MTAPILPLNDVTPLGVSMSHLLAVSFHMMSVPAGSETPDPITKRLSVVKESVISYRSPFAIPLVGIFANATEPLHLTAEPNCAAYCAARSDQYLLLLWYCGSVDGTAVPSFVPTAQASALSSDVSAAVCADSAAVCASSALPCAVSAAVCASSALP